MRRIFRPARLLPVAAALLVGAGAAWAAGGSATAVIHACAAKHGGALRIAAHCRHSEKAVAWNKAGPSGAPGTNGTVGGRGPSDVFANGTAFVKSLGALPESDAHLSLPAGSYLIGADATVFATGAEETDVECLIAPETPPNHFYTTGNTTSRNEFLPGSVSLSTVQTFTSTQTVELDCGEVVGKASLSNAHLWAIGTESVHGTLPVAEA